MEFNETIEALSGEIIFTDNYLHYLTSDDAVMIIDANVYNNFSPFPLKNQIVIKVDENNKSLETVTEIYTKLLEYHATRKTMIYAVGGGITCDIAGFAAATYMRGIPITMIPTTLLSQADASVGGKNGVNFSNLKNIIGTIRQPERVIIDTNLLRTLKHTQISDGLAEIIKIAAVMDAKLFELLENISDKELLNHNSQAFKYILKQAIKNKLEIVRQDEHEAGLRRILNFGHTLAHAIEPIYSMSHGTSVAIGIVFATKLAERYYAADPSISNRITTVLKKAKLPIERKICAASIFQYMSNDKKRENDSVNYVLLNSIGNAETKKIPLTELEAMLYAMYEC